ncbi:MAG: sulfatase [Gammaproteobacteria bacterium]
MKIRRYRNSSILALCALASIVGLSGESVAQSDDDRPNILFIFTDDQGWNDLSVMMDENIPDSRSDYNQTPNIATIAERGMVFSNAYASAPMCFSSRRSFHTGKSAAQSSYSDGAAELHETSMTIGELIQSAGYATAHFGKWSPGPPPEGLDFYNVSDGNQGNGDGNTDDPDNPKDIFGITDRAVAFMEASVESGTPFYMHLSHYAPHMGIQALEETIEAWRDVPPGPVHSNPAYGAMVADLDTGIGTLLNKISELGIEDNTYVIYTSDHGQGMNASSNFPLTFGKGSLWEGGIRVPFIISGPGIAPGSTSDVRTVSLDFYPTFAEIAGAAASVPDDIEGGDLLPVLFNNGDGEIERSRDELIFHFGQPSGQPNSVAASSIYLDDYKLLKLYDTGNLHLFNIMEDPAEQNDLADQMPERVADMHTRMTNYLTEVSATIPDPSRARGSGMGPGGMGMGMGPAQ